MLRVVKAADDDSFNITSVGVATRRGNAGDWRFSYVPGQWSPGGQFAPSGGACFIVIRCSIICCCYTANSLIIRAVSTDDRMVYFKRYS